MPGHTVKRGCAVVVGGSMAGMLAARAASDWYERVVVVERDRLPDGPEPRRGAPQTRQLHALLEAGANAMDDLHPGLLAELSAAGAVMNDPVGDISWYMDGRRLASAPSSLINYGMSRPLLDLLIRQRTAALPNVEIRENTEASGLSEASGSVTGVKLGQARSADQGSEMLPADLVIDAAGRGSQSMRWLRELGYPDPPQSRVQADVVYLTRRYSAAANPHAKPRRAVVVPYPGRPRGAAMVHEENDQIALVLFGLLGTEPPSDDAGMLEYARSLGSDEIISLVRNGTPLGEPVKMRYPASVRQHPERAKALPRNFLLLGDSLAAFNPTYGQGMTTAALQAQLLKSLLADGTARLPQRFYPRAAKVIDQAWNLATGGDLRFPEVSGKRPPLSGPLNKYLDRFRAAAVQDPAMTRTFLEVSNMMAPASRLMQPATMLRVLTAKTPAS
jgi:2-polyprenyl-6-methoxyphenol hydroxylase-like FAD-dependent oxidoreductase